MKIYTNCKLNLSVGSWPPKRKDMQLLFNKKFYVLLLHRSADNWQSNFTICAYFHSSILERSPIIYNFRYELYPQLDMCGRIQMALYIGKYFVAIEMEQKHKLRRVVSKEQDSVLKWSAWIFSTPAEVYFLLCSLHFYN